MNKGRLKLIVIKRCILSLGPFEVLHPWQIPGILAANTARILYFCTYPPLRKELTRKQMNFFLISHRLHTWNG